MASRIVERLRSEALNLPDAERAELACNLVQSLDAPSDADAVKKWDAEILWRLDQIAPGPFVYLVVHHMSSNYLCSSLFGDQ